MLYARNPGTASLVSHDLETDFFFKRRPGGCYLEDLDSCTCETFKQTDSTPSPGKGFLRQLHATVLAEDTCSPAELLLMVVFLSLFLRLGCTPAVTTKLCAGDQMQCQQSHQDWLCERMAATTL